MTDTPSIPDPPPIPDDDNTHGETDKEDGSPGAPTPPDKEAA